MYRKTPPKMLSPSQIGTYTACPRRWYNQYILGIKDDFKFALIRGSLVHSCIEDFFRFRPADFKPDVSNDYESSFVENILAVFNRKWSPELMQKLCDKEKMDYDHAKAETAKSLMKFATITWWGTEPLYRKYKNFNKAWWFSKPHFSERKLKSERLHLRGIVDSVIDLNGHKIIVDYKTANIFKIPFSDEYLLQLTMYSLMFKEEEGIFIDIVSNAYVKHGVQSFYKITEEDLAEAEKIVLDIWEKTRSQEQEDYPCNTDYKFCGKWCAQMTRECPCHKDYGKPEEDFFAVVTEDGIQGDTDDRHEGTSGSD